MKSHSRLLIAVTLGVVGYLLSNAVFNIPVELEILVGWNIATHVYLASAIKMMIVSDKHAIEKQALVEDEGQWRILALSMIAVGISMVAIVALLASAKGTTPTAVHLLLPLYTIFVSWLFVHSIFAIHYAHEYYKHLPSIPSLLFLNEPNPDYWDFLYVALVIGACAQTADVSFGSKKMRRTGTAHTVFSFIFNTTILALTINVTSNVL